MLLRDPGVIEALIDEAKSGKSSDWYTSPQDEQFRGPYRHHLRKRVQYVRSVIAEATGDDKRILDLGCGDGNNLRWMADLPGALYGSDYNMTRLSRASSVDKARLFLADVTDYPMGDDTFDIILFNHVLEHIPDDGKALAEVRRILKPGGVLILGVPNEGALFWRTAYRLQPQTRENTDHVHFYTPKSVRQKCEDAGLLVRKLKMMGWGFPHWTIDAKLRTFKVVDDAFEIIGRAVMPGQASSMYLELTK